MTADAKGPLDGITVLDLSRVLAGPYCTLVLADLGARVIKVERPGSGDDARQIGPFMGNRSAYFMSLNRAKQSIALDLKDAADREIFEALLARADVLVENYRPGTLDRLGYTWETLHTRFPTLTLAAISGFGQTGPYAPRPAYDIVVQGMGGVMSLTGHPGTPPTRVGTSMGDITAGLFGAIGIQAALVDRARTGRGQRVDVAMLDCQVAILENAIARYCATGQVPGPIGARHPSITPFSAYRTRAGHIIIAAGNDELFARLCVCLGRAELSSDPRFVSNELRTQNCDALAAEIEGALARADVSSWLTELESAGIPCGPMNDVGQVLDDPQIAARNMVVPVEGVPGLRVAGNPIKLSSAPDPPSRSAPPELDGDREALLAELGLDG